MNVWAVIWIENNRKHMKNGFQGDLPKSSGAYDFAKSLVARGILVDNVHVISKRKAYGPTKRHPKPPQLGMWWCPYCLKWRYFREFAVRRDGIIGPAEMRCPICTISIHDFYVRKYNQLLTARIEMTAVRLKKVKKPGSRK